MILATEPVSIPGGGLGVAYLVIPERLRVLRMVVAEAYRPYFLIRDILIHRKDGVIVGGHLVGTTHASLFSDLNNLKIGLPNLVAGDRIEVHVQNLQACQFQFGMIFEVEKVTSPEARVPESRSEVSIETPQTAEPEEPINGWRLAFLEAAQIVTALVTSETDPVAQKALFEAADRLILTAENSEIRDRPSKPQPVKLKVGNSIRPHR